MTSKTDGSIPRPVKAVLLITALVLVGSIAIMWSINTLGAGLELAQPIAFRHAIALELLVGLLAATIGLGLRLGAGRRHLEHG